MKVLACFITRVLYLKYRYLFISTSQYCFPSAEGKQMEMAWSSIHSSPDFAHDGTPIVQSFGMWAGCSEGKGRGDCDFNFAEDARKHYVTTFLHVGYSVISSWQERNRIFHFHLSSALNAFFSPFQSLLLPPRLMPRIQFLFCSISHNCYDFLQSFLLQLSSLPFFWSTLPLFSQQHTTACCHSGLPRSIHLLSFFYSIDHHLL